MVRWWMTNWRSSRVLGTRVPFVGYAVVLAATAATSLIVGALEMETHVYDASLLYLLVILAGAVVYGTGPAVAVALASVVLFDWFLEPIGTLVPSGPDELLSLSLFLIVGIVTGQLASAQRRRAHEAIEREREATTLSTINSLIVSSNEPDHFIRQVLLSLPRDLAIHGLALMVPNADGKLETLATAGETGPDSAGEHHLAERAFQGKGNVADRTSDVAHWEMLTTNGDRSDHEAANSPRLIQSTYAAIRGGDRPIGVLRFCRASDLRGLTRRERRFLDAVGQQFGIALERARLQAEAAEAAVMRQAEEAKTAVLHSVTHDLRTPLAMIKAAAGNLHLRDVEWTREEQERFIVSIEKNVDRLDRIVGNLLDLSWIDAGLARPERAYYPLAMVVDDVADRLLPLLANHPLVTDVPDDLPPVLVNYVAIDRVLSNLIENAIRHTPLGTSIVVSASEGSGEIVVSVTDNGPGIAPSVLPHVFERFYRGAMPRSDARSGLGLGLAVAKGLVEAHEGRIWVESRVGAGARFCFTLPLQDSVPSGPYLADGVT